MSTYEVGLLAFIYRITLHPLPPRQMDSQIVLGQLQQYYLTTMEAETPKPVKGKGKKANNADLLKYERPMYEIKRNKEGKVDSIIQKLMQEQKQKPQIGFLPRSHLLHQLDSFIPTLLESNEKLKDIEIQPEQRIDAKLEEVPDSSSSDEEEDENAMVNEVEKIEEEVQQPTVLESCDQFQFNIMTYPYLQDKQKTENSMETDKVGETAKVVEVTDSSGKVVEIEHEMENLD